MFFSQIRVISVLMNSFAAQMVYSTHPHLGNFEALVDPRISLTLVRKRPFSWVLEMDLFSEQIIQYRYHYFIYLTRLGARVFLKTM